MAGLTPSRAGSHKVLWRTNNLLSIPNPCGSWLASDSGESVDINVADAVAIAGKPAPTFECIPHVECIGLRVQAGSCP
ncbi:hypothetical protein DMX03_05675 [Pseudomonas koreensis]|nr:hypothetical protein DMX03_05675 [Pseudomonas koreensis]